MRQGTICEVLRRVVAILLPALLIVPMQVMAELPKYQVLDLGVPSMPGYPSGYFYGSVGYDINDSAEIVGGVPCLSPIWCSFILRDGQMKVFLHGPAFVEINNVGQAIAFVGDMGTQTAIIDRNDDWTWVPGGGDPPYAPVFPSAINKVGQATGQYIKSILGPSTSAFLFSGGVTIPLDKLVAPIPGGSTNCIGSDLNDSGKVVGSCTTYDLSEPPTSITKGFLYGSAGVVDIGHLGGSWTSPAAINASGQVTGDSRTIDGFTHAFLYDGGEMTDLDTLGGDESSARKINDAGQVTGFAKTSGGYKHAFLYSNGEMTDLGTLGGDLSEGVDINNGGEVAGTAKAADGHDHAFIYSNGEMIDLGTLGRTDSEARAINNLGQVTGRVFDKADEYFTQRAFLATPISLLFTRLRVAVTGVGSGKSLANSVKTANTYYVADDLQSTCTALDYFADQVNAFSTGKKPKITTTQAEGFSEQGQAIKDAVGCP